MNQDFREKYRPKAFSEVVGNQRVVKKLINMVKMHEIPRGALFYGPTGSGKTTLARLFVKALHCLDFNGDVCGRCEECIQFENHFPGSNNFEFHDCAKMSGRELDDIIETLRKGFPISRTGLQIHNFDEFHRAKEPMVDKFLIPLEQCRDILLIFCLIEMKNIPLAFRDRVTVLKTNPPEESELIPWLKRICMAEKITVKGDALKQVVVSANRLPRACLSLLQQAYFLKEPLTISLVRELARDMEESSSPCPEYSLVK